MINSLKIILIILILNINSCFSQNQFTKVNTETRKLLNRFLKAEKIPGISLTISYNDTIVFSEGFGYADLENKIKIDPSKTKFRIASITKVLTAGTIVKISESGLIDTKKSVYCYLDSLPKKKYDFTIEQVGGHLAGLRRVASEEKYSCDNKYNKNDFYRVFKNDSLLFKPSTSFSYSNYGYKILGVLVEKITGSDIVENHKKYLIEPLGLKNTIPDLGVLDSLISKFYVRQKNELLLASCLDCTFKYAQGCYLSTSEDLIKIGNSFLFIDRIFKKESLLKLINSQTLLNGKKTNYGFGFTSVKDSNGNFFYGHNGGYEGSSSSIIRVYPKSKIVIAILVNTFIEDLDSLTSKLANLYITKN